MAFRARWGDDADLIDDDEEMAMDDFRPNVEVITPASAFSKCIVGLLYVH